jgi:hypothetical protein
MAGTAFADADDLFPVAPQLPREPREITPLGAEAERVYLMGEQKIHRVKRECE